MRRTIGALLAVALALLGGCRDATEPQTAAGFKGIDSVRLEVSTGSDEASPPTKIQKLTIRFEVQ